MSTALPVYALGFLAQGFFSARMLAQWLLSERAHRVLSPNVYWVCSLAGSVLLFVYGWLRSDFAIVLGQLLSYYVYIWNLNIKGLWQRLPLPLRLPVASLPVVALAMMLSDLPAFVGGFLMNESVPLPLLLWGSAGQVLFTLRFVYQWHYSRRRKTSLLPLGFWLLSLAGSAIIVSYAVFRLDPVLIVGQSFGLITYTRNIVLTRSGGSEVSRS